MAAFGTLQTSLKNSKTQHKAGKLQRLPLLGTSRRPWAFEAGGELCDGRHRVDSLGAGHGRADAWGRVGWEMWWFKTWQTREFCKGYMVV